eukprot:1146955_1
MAQRSIPSNRQQGVCKKFVIDKGFGFISCGDGCQDIFVHISEIHRHLIPLLRPGQAVEFDIVRQRDGRRKAVNVTAPNGPLPQTRSQKLKSNNLSINNDNNDTFDCLVKRYKLASESPICDICANLSKESYLENNNYLSQLLARSSVMNVTKILILGLDRKQWNISKLLCHKYANRQMLYYGLGVHPHNASKNNNHKIDLQSAIIKSYKTNTIASGNKIVCIGECGLDYNRMFSAKQDQCHVFRQHIRAALALQFPLVCHEREGFDDFIKIITQEMSLNTKENVLPIPVIIHCFTGNAKELIKYVSMGFYIGITTFLCIEHRAKELKRCIAQGLLPLDQLLIETDSPFMKPYFNKNEGNEKYELITKHFVTDKNRKMSNKRKRKPRNEPCLLPTLLNTLEICYNHRYTKRHLAETTMETSKRSLAFDISILCVIA